MRLVFESFKSKKSLYDVHIYLNNDNALLFSNRFLQNENEDIKSFFVYTSVKKGYEIRDSEIEYLQR